MTKTKRTEDPLQELPGVGPSIAEDLRQIGFREPADLNGANPRRMYDDLCEIRGERMDPCVLYVFRCAVYAAMPGEKEPELAKWWNWKDREWNEAQRARENR